MMSIWKTSTGSWPQHLVISLYCQVFEALTRRNISNLVRAVGLSPSKAIARIASISTFARLTCK